MAVIDGSRGTVAGDEEDAGFRGSRGPRPPVSRRHEPRHMNRLRAPGVPRRLCRLVWLPYSASWQPRLPDPSYASPALVWCLRTRAAPPSRRFLPSIVISSCGGQAPGRGHWSRGAMTHDKIRAAARKRMAETGEPYAAARREVIKNYQETGAGAPSSTTKWFAISYNDMGPVSLWTDRLLGGGPGRGGVELDPAELRVRMADFHLDVPRGSVRSAARSDHQTRGTIGVHSSRGSWLVTARMRAWSSSSSIRPAIRGGNSVRFFSR
jgi:hypothetical protein